MGVPGKMSREEFNDQVVGMETISGKLLDSSGNTFEEVERELQFQEYLWGQQSHPDFDGEGWAHRVWHQDQLDTRKRSMTRHGDTWEGIAFEELHEACLETEPLKIRQELIETIAVLTNWVADIDSRA